VGAQTEKTLRGGYGYFLEPHNLIKNVFPGCFKFLLNVIGFDWLEKVFLHCLTFLTSVYGFVVEKLKKTG